ncbi:hypothetical protein DSO57_1021292 [Entomophthora muscae]|uniref:Uncharacterized protein n=1 Tax=Entomophthora muscae TaxID=34485 RepID=A0ACC2TR16_9FUNG|nr:hypothetical protein DSO57_1021292 [Entomophthora muscae]
MIPIIDGCLIVVLPIYWLVGEPLGEAFRDLLGAPITQEGPRSNKNKPIKRQASKGSKDPATTPKCAKKPENKKTPTLSLLTPSLPLPLPSSFHSRSSSPCKLLPNKSDDNLTDHSFYDSEADSELIKECRTKKGKAAKELTSSSGKKRRHPRRPQRILPLPLMDLFSLPHLTPKMSLRSTPRSSKLLVTWLGIH